MGISRMDQAVYNVLNASPIDLGYYHPYIVDFAVVLPVVAIFFHFVSILVAGKDNKDTDFFKAANILFFGSVIAIILAYITGIDGSVEMRESLSREGRQLFDAHAALGRYLFLGFFLLLLIKLISLVIKKEAVRYLVGTLFFIAVLVLLYQNTLGNSLVFDYAAGVVTSPY